MSVSAAACARDPKALKAEFVTKGDQYVAKQQWREAIIEYRNAIGQDETDGAVRLKLGDVYYQVKEFVNALGEYVRAADLMPDNPKAQLAAGQGLLLAGRFPEAKARAMGVLEKQPKNIDALILMANATAGLKDIDQAITQIEDAIQTDPNRTLSFGNLGILELRKGNFQAAEAALKRALEIDPKSETARLNLANYYWASNKLADAERELKAAVEINPKSVRGNQALANFYLIDKNRRSEAEPYLKAYADASGEVGSRLILADYYMSDGKIEPGTAVLRSLLESKEGFIPARLRLAMFDFANGRSAQAYEGIQEVFKREPKNPAAMVTNARFLIADQKNAEALTMLDDVIKGDPKSVPGLYLRGVALQSSGRRDDAIEAYRAVLAVSPTTTQAQLALAALVLDKGDATTAAQLAAQVVKTDPLSAEAHVVLTKAMIRQGNVAAAQKEVELLVRAASDKAEVQGLLGEYYFAKNDLAQSRVAYNKQAQLAPDSLEALSGLVRIDIAQKNFPSAKARLEPALVKTPNDATLHFLAGATYLAIGDLQSAEKAYRRTIELDPMNMEAYNRLATILKVQNRLDEAKTQYAEVAARSPKNAVGPTTMIGVILTMQGKHDEARKQYQRALDLDSEAGVAANNLAWYYAEDGTDLDTALKLAQIAKKKFPKSAEASDTQGWVYYKKGLGSLAVASLKEAAALAPSNPVVQYHLGLAHLKNGNPKDGKQALQAALRLDPNFEGAADAKRALAEIKE